MGQRGESVTVVITPEKSDLWGNLTCALKKKIIENLESQWGKRDIKPHSNWIGIKSRPVRAITAVKLKLSGTVSHCVHTLVLLEAFKGGANHCYLKTQPLLYPPPTHSNHQMIEKMYNNYTTLHICPVAVRQGPEGDCSGSLLWKRCRTKLLWHD